MNAELEKLVNVARLSGKTVLNGASPDAVKKAESSIGVPLSKDLREWLYRCSGTEAGEGGILGVAPAERDLQIATIAEIYPHWRELGWIPIATDGCGNYYVLVNDASIRREVVAFVDTMESVETLSYVVASSLFKFLRFIMSGSEPGWPFEREQVVEIVPDILRVSVAPLPWVMAD